MEDKFKKTKWIEIDPVQARDEVITYKKSFDLEESPIKAEVYVTACGIYALTINNILLSSLFSPGFDCYDMQMPYQKYDVLYCLREKNEIRLEVSRGWYGWFRNRALQNNNIKRRVKFLLKLEFENGKVEYIQTDNTWRSCYSGYNYSDIYNGEFFDANLKDYNELQAKQVTSKADKILYLSNADKIIENERIKPIKNITTPKGEYVLDFGQNIIGYVEINIDAKEGDVIEISHAETLDKDGNFYNENFRSAKAKLKYICRQGKQTYKPKFSFFGFRYIRLDKNPTGICADNFTAIVVHTDIKRTGYIKTSNQLLNKFFENVIWSQKDNFFDIPIDCPQRDERMGWTGDGQMFCKTASFNFDCEKFYLRWLSMLRCEQKKYGYTPNVVPDVYNYGKEGFSSGWSDASTIIPWTIYQIYGDKEKLRENFDIMKRHVDAITAYTKEKFLWVGRKQLGDWLGLDGDNKLEGGSDKDLIASAFYAYSTAILIKAGKEIDEDMSFYENLYKNIREKFIKTYNSPKTQTECVLMLQFDLTNDKKKVSNKLVELICNCGKHLQTGFVGTPYLLYALSENGEVDLAYELLLRDEFPSWLYSVKCGATTIWEHWDSKNENGDLWPAEMNSFNHYVYGAVVDWLYSVAGGIIPAEEGFKRVRIAPKPSKRLDFFEVSFKSRNGEIYVKWENVGGKFVYTIVTPVDAIVDIDGKEIEIKSGKYKF